MLGLTAKLLLLCPSTEEVRRSKAVGDAPRGPSRFRKLADAPDGSGPCLLWVQKRTLVRVPYDVRFTPKSGHRSGRS